MVCAGVRLLPKFISSSLFFQRDSSNAPSPQSLKGWLERAQSKTQGEVKSLQTPCEEERYRWQWVVREHRGREVFETQKVPGEKQASAFLLFWVFF